MCQTRVFRDRRNREREIMIQPDRGIYLVLLDGAFYATCDNEREAEDEAEELILSC